MAERNGEQIKAPITPAKNKPGIIASLVNQVVPEPKILSREEAKRIRLEQVDRQKRELKAKKWAEVIKMAKEKRSARMEQLQSEPNVNKNQFNNGK